MSVVPSPDLVSAEAPAPAAIDDVNPGAWPRTRLVSASLTLALAAALALPGVTASLSHAGRLALMFPILLAAIAARWTFQSRDLERHARTTARVLVAILPPTAVALLIAHGSAAIFNVTTPLWAMIASIVLVPCVFVAAAELRGAEIRAGRASRRVFFIGSAEQQTALSRDAHRHGDIRVVDHADVSSLATHGFDEAGLFRRVIESHATVVVLSAEATRDSRICSLASRINLTGRRVRDLNGFYERTFHKVPLSELTPSWFLFDIAAIHRPRLYGSLKRAGELIIASLLLAASAPVLIGVAVAVKVSSPGPTLFRQRRVGLHDEPFTLLKFRTMRVTTEPAIGWAPEHRARVTPVGRLLRRLRIDELPQLWNVFRGELSLVGPRPEQVPLVADLEASIPFYTLRHRVRPGLTGWAQVHHGYGGGYVGTMAKLQYDFYYVRHQRLRLDLLILALTWRAIVQGPDR